MTTLTELTLTVAYRLRALEFKCYRKRPVFTLVAELSDYGPA